MTRAPDDLVVFCHLELPRVRGALALYLGDSGTAAELAQEAFVRACRDWELVRTMDRPGAWVHRVAMNLATSELRRRRAERRALRRAGAIERDAVRDPSTGPAVRAAIEALPPDERAAVVLRYYADLSIADTAAVLGVPEGTVKTRTHRAIGRMRAMGLAADVDEEEVRA